MASEEAKLVLELVNRTGAGPSATGARPQGNGTEPSKPDGGAGVNQSQDNNDKARGADPYGLKGLLPVVQRVAPSPIAQAIAKAQEAKASVFNMGEALAAARAANAGAGPTGTGIAGLAQGAAGAAGGGLAAFAAAAGAAAAGVFAIKAVGGLMTERADALQNMSPAVARATANAELREYQQRARSAARIGDEVADWVTATSRLKTAWQDLKDTVVESAGETATAAANAGTVGVWTGDKILRGSRPIGIAANPGGWILNQIINKALEKAAEALQPDEKNGVQWFWEEQALPGPQQPAQQQRIRDFVQEAFPGINF
jgi:hypothetical protein